MNGMIREMGNRPVATVTLGGREFRLTELNWNDYCEIEETFGKDTREWRGVAASRFILWLGLRKQEPSLTLERVGELVQPDEFETAADAIDALMGRSGDDVPPKNG